MIARFLRHEAAGGWLLMLATAGAMALANSPLADAYRGIVEHRLSLGIGGLTLSKPLLLWINDGLMSLFFLLVGLELKREWCIGELKDRARASLAGFGAVGGMLVPAGIYLAVNHGDPAAQTGWAVPVATDIAFALGVLGLLGGRIPKALKVFLVSLAIFDDLGAVAVIAIFYTDQISLPMLAASVGCLGVLTLFHRLRIHRLAPYLVVGFVLWLALLKSGVHATLAGVALAMFIPLNPGNTGGHPPLIRLEHALTKPVSLGVLPVFALANAGVPVPGWQALVHPVPLGIALGLAIGKPVGVLAACALGVRLGLARLPRGLDWRAIAGAAFLCGIGFTMSLFIGSLAFEESGVPLLFDERIGILAGSLVSAVLGLTWLRASLPVAQRTAGD